MAYVNKLRNKNRFVFRNNNIQYEEIIRRKKIASIGQYGTANIVNLSSVKAIKTISHIWTTGDRYYKLAHRYYGNPSMWWIIALYNKKPTESHLKKGQRILIPTPINLVMYYL
jgi:nucleoid-associated protein YgaU